MDRRKDRPKPICPLNFFEVGAIKRNTPVVSIIHLLPYANRFLFFFLEKEETSLELPLKIFHMSMEWVIIVLVVWYHCGSRG